MENSEIRIVESVVIIQQQSSDGKINGCKYKETFICIGDYKIRNENSTVSIIKDDLTITVSFSHFSRWLIYSF